MVNNPVDISLGPQESFVIAQYARYVAPDDSTPCLSRQFLLDFAILFLRQTSETSGLISDASVEILSLGEHDVLSLIELVPATASVGSVPVGLTLHRKLYEALLRCHPEAATELRFGDHEEPTKEAVTTQLRALKRRKGRKGRGGGGNERAK